MRSTEVKEKPRTLDFKADILRVMMSTLVTLVLYDRHNKNKEFFISGYILGITPSRIFLRLQNEEVFECGIHEVIRIRYKSFNPFLENYRKRKKDRIKAEYYGKDYGDGGDE